MNQTPEAAVISPVRHHTLKQVARYLPQINAVVDEFYLDRWTVIGIIAQESAGNPYAIRCEPGFWKLYGKEMLRRAIASADQNDDLWMRYPQIASTSYGLMQVMYETALEFGAKLRYPTELCDPAIGIKAGCGYFRWCMQVCSGDEYQALMRYNGGGDLDYPRRVIAWAADARVSGLFPTVHIT